MRHPRLIGSILLAIARSCIAFGSIAIAIAGGTLADQPVRQEASDWVDWHVGVGVATGIDDFDDDLWDHQVDDAVGVSIELGRRINAHFALDLRAHYFVDAFRHSPHVCEGGDESDVGAVTAGVKLFPWRGSIEPHVSAGVGGVYRRFVQFGCEDGKEVAANGAVTGVRVGGGFDFRLNRRWSLGFEAQHVIPIESGTPLFRYTTVGVDLRFHF